MKAKKRDWFLSVPREAIQRAPQFTNLSLARTFKWLHALVKKHPSDLCKIVNYPKKISDSWLFIERTEKVFFIFRAYGTYKSEYWYPYL